MPLPALLPHRVFLASATLLLAASALGQTVHIQIDGNQGRRPISPYLYGRNNCLSDDPARPLTAAEWQRLRDAGVRLVRDHGGNNGTKYNWQKKLSSHPDWYNNVYAHDWDYVQRTLQENLPGVQGLWCFQLLGKVADNTTHNFNDWAYNQSQWWAGVGQNLAGGGTPDPAGGQRAKVEGAPSQYLTDTSAETSTAILDHWIRSNGLKLDRRQFRYWNMDNEPEIWSGTHDDVMPTQLPAEQFMQRYFEYAKRARARYPEIKLMGPVPANEWQWYRFGDPIIVGGKTYPWLEYFIKRVGEEQARTGIRLLDVLDVHHYPALTHAADVVQQHRVFFDREYVNPEANGVHGVNGGWDTSINQEYIFARCQEWLRQYLGEKHGVTFAVTETGLAIDDPAVTSVWYASLLGEFMRNGVEVFAPWSWKPGMWEVLHLFSRYNGGTQVSATSENEAMVSAYASLDEATGNVTVVLVNRELSQARTAEVTLAGFGLPPRTYSSLQLADLPPTETFVSHAANALRPGTVALSDQRFTTTLPPLSVTSVLLHPTSSPPPSPPPASSRLANVSVRARAGTGEQVLIVGMVIGGTGSKQVLLRGIGPTLRDYGVPTPLADPQLILYRRADSIAENDRWAVSEGDAIAAAAQAVGAFPLPRASADAALLPTLAAGAYTAHIRGADGGQGVVLGEAYETDLTSSARFINVAARTWVGVDADSLIAGFVISGAAEKTVLIRAVGPGLTQHGVTGVLTNPVLRLFRAGIELPVFHNDDWGATAYADEIAATATQIGAFALDASSADATLLVTLPKGVYTAMVSGANGTTGVALIEVYDVR